MDSSVQIYDETWVMDKYRLLVMRKQMNTSYVKNKLQISEFKTNRKLPFTLGGNNAQEVLCNESLILLANR